MRYLTQIVGPFSLLTDPLETQLAGIPYARILLLVTKGAVIASAGRPCSRTHDGIELSLAVCCNHFGANITRKFVTSATSLLQLQLHKR
jgi:hypothetical protein